MFLDVAKSKQIQIKTKEDAIRFFKSEISFKDMLSEFNKLLKIVLTIPVSSCTAERSFSALRNV